MKPSRGCQFYYVDDDCVRTDALESEMRGGRKMDKPLCKKFTLRVQETTDRAEVISLLEQIMEIYSAGLSQQDVNAIAHFFYATNHSSVSVSSQGEQKPEHNQGVG